ncbi:MAG TPA: agmatinase [Kofleriaceae bacterium]|nr:agmatinase [Kofleriaceae bacterium]
MTQQSAMAYLRHGLTPFFRLPATSLLAQGTSPADATALDLSAAAYRGADAVLLGVPHDGGTTYQPGARFAPFDIRRVSALVQGYHQELGVDVFATVRAVDGGNVVFPPFDRATMRAAVQQEISEVLAAGAAPFVVGGDHSISLPCLRALAKAHGPLAVVHVDAHLDTSSAEVWGDEYHHGTPIRHAIQEGLIAPGQLHQVGLRATWGKRDEDAVARSIGGSFLTMSELEALGSIARAMSQVRERLGAHPVYLTFDIDAVDPAFAPGTGTPVPGGLTSREALAVVRGLAGANLVGMDLVEVAPALDHADLTCHLGAHLLFEGLAVLAMRPDLRARTSH